MKTIQLEQFADVLQARPRDAHKGHFGHVLVVGGDHGYAGAVRLAAEAALRVGAGLVSVATRFEHVNAVMQQHPEMMVHAVSHPADLTALLARATVLVLGPGLGRSEWSWMMREAALASGLPTVLDADALTMLADFPAYRSNWILTPHPGEAARLLKKSVEVIQHDRQIAVESLVRDFGGVAVLKGMGTLVAGDALPSEICMAGNPGMASGGMGDVLAGVIGGLWAQGVSPDRAAKLGVLLHAMAGDLAALAGERGMLATDLMAGLRQLINKR